MSSKRTEPPLGLGGHCRGFRFTTQKVGEDEEQRCPFVMWSLRYPGRCSSHRIVCGGKEKRQDSEDIVRKTLTEGSGRAELGDTEEEGQMDLSLLGKKRRKRKARKHFQGT